MIHDPEWFRRDILPGLATVKLSEIVEAAGGSKAYASDIRRGKWTPHVSTWPALSTLGHEAAPLVAISVPPAIRTPARHRRIKPR
jgi:hypothetical protein